MRKVKLDNSDLLAYFNTIEELKNHPSMEEYRTGYRKLRDDDAFSYEINKYRSAHTTLRRLDKKRQSLLNSFIGELNPISYSAANTAAKSSGNFDLINERILYRKAIEEKSDAEIIALVIKQRTEAALAFQRSVELSLEQLSSISLDFESSNKSRRKMSF
ncbi:MULTISPECIES: DUF4756 family protein [Enterobacter cloacae complex]|uniref:DUF4756 family protein n=1 Tax=Enterobacter sichuanensis TaxID=2071710 RepID=A0AAE4DYK2_9ENTR|nr:MULTISPECIES: DUF4756 family protein [Enterobacter cloacae complex]CAF2436516.1 hypothetical protein AI2839V1_1572 [Enterobacter cloacae]EJO48228.1 hypothetical protein B498_0606 [Enterobacter sp. SST3]MDR9947540.1 DUF4756 family protein [Enterobacter sichuanensis]NHA09709.1 DUF4756 family protein [Enterobacter roggenkampii]CAH5196062.1 hypothetical protein AI2839V1_1572 [Enterobacter cloacae]